MHPEIKDIRHIRFPKEVLPLALAANPATLGLRAPPAEIGPIAIEAQEPPALRVTFRPILSSPCEQCSVGAAALAAALIAYCRHIRVPIPRTACKSIRFEGNTIVLLTDHRQPLTNAPGPARGDREPVSNLIRNGRRDAGG